MPGPIVHMVVQQRLHTYLDRLGGVAGKAYADLLHSDLCSPYTAFGSIGPDFLFFTLTEYGTILDELVNFLFKVYDAFDPLIDFYQEHIEPIEDAIGDAINDLDEALLNGIFGDLRDTLGRLISAIFTAIAKVSTDNVDLFYPFYPKIQQGAPESEWYWFDFLHYRRTGRFASTMWRMAEEANDASLKRYVLGYASHIATDVVGHPFVNNMVGGPYRTHWHRHKLVENWIDAYARNYYSDSQAVLECLNLKGGERYLEHAISGSYYYKLLSFEDEKLPDNLKRLFVNALVEVYSDVEHPPFLSQEDVDSAYRLWRLWFRRATRIGYAEPPTPVAPPTGAARRLVEEYINGLPKHETGAGGGGGFWETIRALFAFAKFLADVLFYTIDYIINHIDEILLLPLEEMLATIKWSLYLIRKGIWEVYDSLRFALVLGAYLFPEPRDLARDPWGKAFLFVNQAHQTGGDIADFFKYPRRQERHGLLTPEHHYTYPSEPQELPHAEPAPRLFDGEIGPESFIDGEFDYDPFIESLYYALEPYGGSDSTHEIDEQTWNTAQFGSALAFSARLISHSLGHLPNFNLDGDRGYGWKTWRAKNSDLESSDPVNVDYIDADN